MESSHTLRLAEPPHVESLRLLARYIHCIGRIAITDSTKRKLPRCTYSMSTQLIERDGNSTTDSFAKGNSAETRADCRTPPPDRPDAPLPSVFLDEDRDCATLR